MRGKNFKKVLLLALAFLLVFPSQALGKEGLKERRRTILLLLNQITWEDVIKAKTPFIDSLIKEGAVGLVSARTVGTKTTWGRAAVTLGAGNRAESSFAASQAFNADEPFEGSLAQEAYFRRTGSSKPPSAAIIHLGISSLQQKNMKLPYVTQPGALGERLKKSHLKTAVLGNSDLSLSYREDLLHREAVAIAMDKKGVVDYGEISKEILISDQASPFGFRTNEEELLKRFADIKKVSHFIVVDFGDTTRSDFYSSWTTPEMATRQRLKALERADTFTKKLFSLINLGETLVIMGSVTPPSYPQRQQLTPLIMVGKGVKPGYLFSSTTLRKGLVSSVDIAPTILNFFSLSVPTSFTGRKIISVPFSKEGKIVSMVRFNQIAILRDAAEPTTITTFILFQILIFLATLAILFFKRSTPRLISFFSGLILSIITVPLTLFLGPFLIPIPNLLLSMLASLILLVILIALALGLRKKKFTPLILISGLTIGVLVIDLFWGAELNINSIFGYSPIVAGRFYGLGNQAVAILVATSLLGSTAFFEHRKSFSRLSKIWLLATYLFLVFVIGFPRLGANTGGTIMACTAFGTTYLHLLQKKIGLKEILLIVVATVLALSLFVIVDLYQVKEFESHMGKSAELIKAQGSPVFFQIVRRKILTNLRILRYSSWSYFLLVILALLAFLRLKPLGEFQRIFSKYPYLGAGITGALSGGIVGFLTNDSGIAIPALILSYFTTAIFYLMLQDHTQNFLLKGKQAQIK